MGIEPDASKGEALVYKEALRLLSIRNYFEKELENALFSKFPEIDMDSVLLRLKNDNYLNDKRFFIDYVRWKLECLYGPYYIKEKLSYRCVKKDISEIKSVIYDLEFEYDDVIVKAIRKYLRTRSSKKDVFQSCLRWLSYRGFPVSDCVDILKKEILNESNIFEDS